MKNGGKNCPKYLVGDFAFAIWNENTKELFCARDHVGKRTFYYYYNHNTFAFCTVIKPIFPLLEDIPKLNEKWIADFLALKGVVQSIEFTETVYEGIFQLEPAYTLTLEKSGIHKKQYWNPLKEVKKLRLKSDKEYEEQFRKVLYEAVKCRLRCISDVGIMLSGGLDSGSIACIAANILSNGGKRLKAFSSIPLKGFKSTQPKYYVTDEHDYIDTMIDKYKNIDVEYCRNEEKNPISDIETFINILEQPYKTVENSFWVHNITEKAAQKGCKVLLSGQYGNSTISFGDFDTHIKTLFSQGKFLTMRKEIDGLSKLHKVPKKRIRKEVYRVLLPYNLRRIVSKVVNRSNKIYLNTAINSELIKKWNVDVRLNQSGYNLSPQKFYTLRGSHKFIVDPVAFSQIAIYETKLPLTYGIVNRDPTRDKRVIEFCLSLPSEQFVRNGVERNLIRRSMEGILPDKVRLNYNKIGLQAADWLQRIRPEWGKVYDNLKKQLSRSDIRKYIDGNKVTKELESHKDKLEDGNGYIIRMLMVTLIFSTFIQKYEEIRYKFRSKGGESYGKEGMG